jgi:short subunit fatty acids transporter
MKKSPVLSALFKWLVITAIVVVVFTLILLGLGYLLKENEKETRELKYRIDNNQVSVHYSTLTPDPHSTPFKLS